MSTLVTIAGNDMLFTKGADNVVTKRLSADTYVNPPDVYEVSLFFDF